jgi:hypothetical protein
MELEVETAAGGRKASVSNEQAGGANCEIPSHLPLLVHTVRLFDDWILP